tara:strand:- start:296 stop:535 length:240 start_codon:yes stop_codon:yes gene_type:complete
MIYKCKIWTFSDKDGVEGEYKDLYLDVESINGFFIPENKDEDDLGINIFMNGDMVTIKQEPHITKYLTNKFVKTCIENE